MFTRQEPIEVITLGTPELDKNTGRYSEPEETSSTYMGNMQPLLGEDLKILTDGDIIYDHKTLYLHVEIFEDDKVIWKNHSYRVLHKEEWSPGSSPLPHYRYIIKKETEIK